MTGGSLGAQRLNEAFAAAAAALSAAGVQVLHVAGTGKGFVAESVTGPPYVVLEYCDRMDLAYAAADLVVARSGANTVCELTAVGLPAVYVPLPVGNGEQRLNAAAAVAAGGGLLVDDADVTPAWVREVVRAAGPRRRPARDDGRGRRIRGGAGWRRAARRPRRRGRARRSPMTGPTPRYDFTAPVPPLELLGRVHLIAIGGAGMSAVARLLLARGVPVSGSDAADSPTLEALRDSGARVDLGHDASHVVRRRHGGRVVRDP